MGKCLIAEKQHRLRRPGRLMFEARLETLFNEPIFWKGSNTGPISEEFIKYGQRWFNPNHNQ